MNYINLCHNVNTSRAYKKDGEFFCFTTTRDLIIPYSTKSIKEMAKHIEKMVDDEFCEVELRFIYMKNSLSKNKKKKLNLLLQEDNCADEKTLMRWVCMLI